MLGGATEKPARPSRPVRWRRRKTAHLPLVVNLVRRDVRARYKGSILGVLWTLIVPAVLVLTYWFVFRFLFRSSVRDYAVFLVTGLSIWTMFVSSTQAAIPSMLTNASLIKKIAFPRSLVPLSAMLAQTITSAVLLVIAIVLSEIVSPHNPLPLLSLLLIVPALLGFVFGLSLALSTANVYLRDVDMLFGAIATPWFFVTPILYTFADLPPSILSNPTLLKLLHYGNPMTPFVFATQDSVFYGVWPNPEGRRRDGLLQRARSPGWKGRLPAPLRRDGR